MRFFYALLLLGCFSCGAKVEENESISEIDSSENTIVEYELNENRLEAVDFNNKLSFIQQASLDKINLLFLSDSSNVDFNLENARFEIDLNITEVKSIKAPEGGEEFKKSLMKLLTYYNDELYGQFIDVVPLMKITSPSENELQQLESYSATFTSLEEELFSKLSENQEKFAIANNIKIQ